MAAPPSPPSAPPPSLARAAFSGASWLSLLNGIGGLGMLGLTWWLNRELPNAPLQMGQWSLVLSLLLMTSLVFEGGLPATIQQRKELDVNALGALAWMQIALGALGTVALALLAGPLASLLAADSEHARMTGLIRLAAPAVLVIAIGLPPKALLQRDLRFRAVGTVEVGSTGLTIVLGVVLGRLFGVTGLVASLVFRHLAETIAYWVLVRWSPLDLLRRHDWAAARDPVRFGLAMAGQSMLATLIRQGDVLLVGAVLGTVAAGVYRQVQTLVVQPLAKLTMYVSRAAFAAFSRAQDDPERILRGLQRLQRLLALAVLPMLLGMAAVSPRLLTEYFGDQYAPHVPVAVVAMHVLCLATAVQSYTYTFAIVLNAAGRSREVLVRQVVATLTMVVAMAAGGAWGLVGVAAGRVVAATVQAGLLLDLARSALRFGRADTIRSLREAVPGAVACFVAAAGIGLLLSRAWPASAPAGGSPWDLRAALVVQVLVGAAVYGIILLALGVRPKAEWKALRG